MEAVQLRDQSSRKVVEVDSLELQDLRGQVTAIQKAQAVIEFSLDGIVTLANENFLKTLGYTLAEIRGQHHRMFCDPVYVNSREYQEFWSRLRRGEFDSGEYRRIGKGGKEVWISASYNPIFDADGRPYKVVKYASDISIQKLKDQELAALSKTQAVINFNLDGTIIDMNDNFLSAMGFSAAEIKGKHHSMFCDPEYTRSNEYREFWANLNGGKFQQGQFKRFAKGHREIWLQASYNPVFDLSGKVFKVVKYATDITKEKNDALNLLATLSETATQLSASSEELTATATNLAKISSDTTERATTAAVGSEEVSAGIQNVAKNTEEMNASIGEIAKSAISGSNKTTESLKRAQEASVIMNQLGQNSDQIGSVIKVISSIAQQTNLLALNATIEAARAGEAGKGFAVVANEVKELAKQTAKATEEIASKISSMQASTSTAVTVIEGISTAVAEVSTISTAIAAAVEEQTATTREVARVVQESNVAVESVSGSIREVSKSALDSSAGATQLLEASKGLNQLAVKLKSIVANMET